MAATWSDIRRLAADFQRIQLTGETKKLSENNCVEVISMLIKANAIDIVFTTDGQNYVTRKHLLTEIKNECIGQGGRISLADLARALNVDFEHIENSVSTIVKQSSVFTLCNAELISREYVNVLCDDLNERLAEVGMISASQLARSWDLPTEILNNLVLVEVGQKVDAVRDGDFLYTSTHLDGQRQILRAVLCALTKVTAIAQIQEEICLTPNIFWTLFDELIAQNEVRGEVIGGRSSNHSFYVPLIHTVLIREFVRKKLFQDKIIELSIFKKLWILDPKTYLKDYFDDKDYSSLVFLPSAVLCAEAWEELRSAIMDELEKNAYVMMRDHLPDSLQNKKDIDEVIQRICKQEVARFEDGIPIIYSDQLLKKGLKALDGYVQKKVQEFMENYGKEEKFTKNDRKKSDSIAASKPKKGRGKAARTSSPARNTSNVDVQRSNLGQMEDELLGMGGFPEELIPDIVQYLEPDVDRMIQERYQAELKNVHAVAAHEQKRTHAQMKRTLHTIYENICMFEIGSNAFPERVAINLRTHLLRTLGVDFANTVLSYVANVDITSAWSNKDRNQAMEGIKDAEVRQLVSKLFTSLDAKNLDSFYDAVFDVSSPNVCALNLKSPDKIRREELLKIYSSELYRQVETSTELPSALLCALLAEIANRFGVTVHASGKFVSHIIEKISSDNNQNSQLIELFTSAQKLVITNLQSKEKDDSLEEKLMQKLNELKSVAKCSNPATDEK